MDHEQFLLIPSDSDVTALDAAQLVFTSYLDVMDNPGKWRTYIIQDEKVDLDTLELLNRFLDIHSKNLVASVEMHTEKPNRTMFLDTEDYEVHIGLYTNGVVFCADGKTSNQRSWMFFVREETAQQWDYPESDSGLEEFVDTVKNTTPSNSSSN